MKKSLLILSFILLSIVSIAQRQRTTAMFDSDTTTRPKSGFVGFGFRGGKLFGVPFSGTTYRILNANTHVGSNGQVLFTNGTSNYFKTLGLSDVGVSGLTTNYLLKWNGTTFINSQFFDNGTTVSLGTILGLSNKFEVGNVGYGTIAAFRSIPNDGINPYLAIKTSANGVTIEQNGSSYKNLYFQTSALDRLSILANGNVGIGTSSPLAKFYVDMPDATAGVIFRKLGGTNNPGIYFTVNEATTVSTIDATASTSGILALATSGVEKMRILNNGNVGIGTISPVASAILDISTTTKGFLPPRMTTAQINAISSPANGLMVYNTTLNKLCVYENGTWKQVTTTNM